MSTPSLSTDQLDKVRRYNTFTIANAIETFAARPRHVGSLPNRVRYLSPEIGLIVGYAVTSQTRALPYEGGGPPESNADYLRNVAARPGREVAAGQDLDDPLGLGAQPGEFDATIRKKIGCVGHVTDGYPRVTDGYVRIVASGKPVNLAGVASHPGDLIHVKKRDLCPVPVIIRARLAAPCSTNVARSNTTWMNRSASPRQGKAHISE